MKKVAQLENNTVINIILVNDDYQLQENELFFTDENPAHIDGEFFDNKFYPLQPYPSWLRSNGNWIPPKPLTKPKYLVYWNEEIVDWSDIKQEKFL